MNDSIIKTLGVAFTICLICSFVVSSTAVSLRDMQNENKANAHDALLGALSAERQALRFPLFARCTCRF